MTWHRMDDRDTPPPTAGRFLIHSAAWKTTPKIAVATDWRFHEEWFRNEYNAVTDRRNSVKATHWAPLLAPPEGEE